MEVLCLKHYWNMEFIKCVTGKSICLIVGKNHVVFEIPVFHYFNAPGVEATQSTP